MRIFQDVDVPVKGHVIQALLTGSNQPFYTLPITTLPDPGPLSEGRYMVIDIAIYQVDTVLSGGNVNAQRLYLAVQGGITPTLGTLTQLYWYGFPGMLTTVTATLDANDDIVFSSSANGSNPVEVVAEFKVLMFGIK